MRLTSRNAPEAAQSYPSGGHLEDGYWFQIIVCVPKELVDRHPQTTKKLRGSGKQIRVATPFMEICGVA